MPIVFAGAAKSDYEYATAATFQTVNPAKLAPGVTEGIEWYGPDSGVKTRFSEPLNNFWFTAFGRIESNNNYPNMYFHFGYVNKFPFDTPRHFYVRWAEWTLRLHSADGTLLAETGIPIVTGQVVRLDMRVRQGSPGIIQIFLNGVQAIEWTGTLNFAQPFDAFWANGDSALGSTSLSTVIIASQDTRLFTMSALPIAGAGTFNQWVGTFSDIDEVGLDITDFISAEAPNLTESFEVTKPPIPVGYNIGAIVFNAQAALYGETVDSIQAIQYDGGLITSMGTFDNLNVGFLGDRVICEVNPATGIRYTPVEYDAIELGFRTQ